MKPFTKNVIQIIKQIPEGNVMTYGQIAKAAGSPRGARQVARILHSMSQKYDLPWHRVINAKGQIAIKDDEGFFSQKLMLQDEGVDVSEAGKVDLEVYLYWPDPLFDEEI
ncbi:DNA methyltransferase [Virgibacillus indicus]|uniref:DNA methyltransferase n=1 Tax=Virgibacillus indicus TaxID=2024554 RepID=A0A265NBI9_9BACI|nr:MGMT family protein [Virgibacillus indicus]OZU89363.1 DNA methyltransferase [Virgibacillus indicus]